jgi:hypothetical protein
MASPVLLSRPRRVEGASRRTSPCRGRSGRKRKNSIPGFETRSQRTPLVSRPAIMRLVRSSGIIAVLCDGRGGVDPHDRTEIDELMSAFGP